MEGLGPHLRELWEQQQGRCHYTGRTMALTGYHAGNIHTATVDRQVPALGYVRGNVVLCCSFVNRMKQDFTLDELLDYCEELLETNAL